ncbi:hypothetical protein GLAREA_10929 [Glarea lozoyensis ATCC 20868]|uniref:BZIP domain-containing protein n=1 Tax=Glarea lozoyensis (strain ATCC 20868 / MF5171) TaxID=1116229 RepID=S3D9U2_GLAL2|nr:uncharacterized protein GLAREA_10929 [Glarea lozoyensis ATCC 20868]EPE35232.1 hypothetical protein GLAREA_10929 [Glarea lozoyensis ATCC 20868]
MDSQDFYPTSETSFNDGAIFNDFDSFILDPSLTEPSKGVWDWGEFSGAMDNATVQNPLMDTVSLDHILLDNVAIGNSENDGAPMGTMNPSSFPQNLTQQPTNQFSNLDHTHQIPQLVQHDSTSSSERFTSNETCTSESGSTPATSPETEGYSPKDDTRPRKKRNSVSAIEGDGTNPPPKKRGRRAIKRNAAEKEKYEKEKRANNAVAAAKSRVKKADQQNDLLQKSHALAAKNADLIQTYEQMKLDLMLLLQEAKTHHSSTCAEGLLGSFMEQCEHTIQSDPLSSMRADDAISQIMNRNGSVSESDACSPSTTR